MRYGTEETTAKIAKRLAKHDIATFEGTTTLAYLNHGRWVADCPECNGAELVAPGMPMVCGSCGAVHKVTFPRNRGVIESALTVREQRLQNWLPGETAADLIAENIDHGIFPDDLKVGS